MRFDKAFEEFFYRAETSGAVLLVAHANLIRYLMCRYVDPDAIGPKGHADVCVFICTHRSLQIPTEAWENLSCAHTSFTTVRLHAKGHVSLTVANYVEHLGHISI